MLSPGLGQHQQLQQRQQLSPQVIQYIKLLQKTSLELEQRIKEELEVNPLLEEGLEQVENPMETLDPEADGESETDAEEDDWDYEDLIPGEDLYGYKARVDRNDEDDRVIPTPYVESLTEQLNDQLALLDLSETDRTIAEQLIGSIDADGYLRRPLESVVDDLSFSYGVQTDESRVESVLKQVQQLEPVGIAARSLQECLLVQLEVLPADTPGRETAIAILEKCYKDFTMKHFQKIMRKLDLDREELGEGYDLIQHLDPKPGFGDSQSTQNFITPDFIVERIDDDFIISLNRRNSPQLRISRGYRNMLGALAAESKSGKLSKIDADTRQFLKSKLDAARWFIQSIQQRRQTMLKVMQAIVSLQEDFFRHGPGRLRPMILKDVAERINMDISTVSRVVNGKYVQTESGVYELKYFFSEGVATEYGEDVSSRDIKALIEKIIEGEDKQKPLSDQRIAEILNGQGFQLARRTVSKYRKQLSIPVARMRKEVMS